MQELLQVIVAVILVTTCVNTLAYADDIVLMAPSWRALQSLLNCLNEEARDIGMSVNIAKTVCMIFSPCSRKYCFSSRFPEFCYNGHQLQFVNTFKHLGHVISDNQSDEPDIQREIRLLFVRANILRSRFSLCSQLVKLRLFQSYCMCFYDIALWTKYSNSIINLLVSAYNRCIKIFFGLPKYHSVTFMLMDLGLPTFGTLLHNSVLRLNRRLYNCNNSVLLNFSCVRSFLLV